ncbi:MAG: hypothetical protein [Olavius algarvensis Delta 4 endosymbiont]|nr:MAG: hypothetical protein [Olavius algarvensis Delta 4 endosymbiont]
MCIRRTWDPENRAACDLWELFDRGCQPRVKRLKNNRHPNPPGDAGSSNL